VISDSKQSFFASLFCDSAGLATLLACALSHARDGVRLLTHIAKTESVSLCERMKKLSRFVE
jgi:hypothetical protein